MLVKGMYMLLDVYTHSAPQSVMRLFTIFSHDNISTPLIFTIFTVVSCQLSNYNTLGMHIEKRNKF